MGIPAAAITLLGEMRTALLAAALALALPGCKRDLPPDARYRAFADAARAGDGEVVWSMLSESSRAALDARARAAAARAPPGVIRSSGRDLVLGDLSPQSRRIRSVSTVRVSGATAVVAVELEGEERAHEVTLVREGGSWRVVLPFAN